MTNVVSDSKLARREQARHYIPASEEEIASMLAQVGCNSFAELFDHIPNAVLFAEKLDLPEELAYEDLAFWEMGYWTLNHQQWWSPFAQFVI